jgi:2'-5' RNA ligase
MRLSAVVIPPKAVLTEVQEVVAHARSSGAAPQHRRGLRSRVGGGANATDEAAAQELDLPDVAKMYLPLTQFGNVTLGDSVKLTQALRTEALKWRRPKLHLEGGTALEFPGDESVWAKLGGDVEDLKSIGRGVPQVVARLGFFVDRRQFRPWLSVATITDQTTAPVLEGVVHRLEGFRGTSWTVETISLIKGIPNEGPDAFEVMEELPLAGD